MNFFSGAGKVHGKAAFYLHVINNIFLPEEPSSAVTCHEKNGALLPLHCVCVRTSSVFRCLVGSIQKLIWQVFPLGAERKCLGAEAWCLQAAKMWSSTEEFVKVKIRQEYFLKWSLSMLSQQTEMYFVVTALQSEAVVNHPVVRKWQFSLCSFRSCFPKMSITAGLSGSLGSVAMLSTSAYPGIKVLAIQRGLLLWSLKPKSKQRKLLR